MIFIFDPATLEVFETHRTLEQLHNVDFTSDTDDLLYTNLFKLVLDSKTIDGVQFGQCIGCKIPVFLGGKDVISNCDLQDMEVYWHFQKELQEKVKHLPDGTKIGKLSLNERSRIIGLNQIKFISPKMYRSIKRIFFG